MLDDRELMMARRAAELLPRPGSSNSPGEGLDSPTERRIAIAMCVVTFVGLAIFLFWLPLTKLPYGAVLVSSGLVMWLVIRFTFFRLRGSETATVAVDDNGLIWVPTGRSAVRRMRRLFEVGSRRWGWASALSGVLFMVGVMAVLVFLCVVSESPTPLGAALTAGGFGCLDFLRFMTFAVLVPRLRGQEMLDGAQMLPVLALYAYHHGWNVAVSGVPANRLADTVAAHPDHARIAAEYAAFVRDLAAFVRDVNG